MEIETLSERNSFTGKFRSAVSIVSGNDLPATILKMKDTEAWRSGELNSCVLINSPGKKVVLTVMHDRTEVKSFQSGDSVAIQIIEGKMKIQTSQKTILLDEGQLLELNVKGNFILTSLEESSFMLTILTGDLKSKGN